MQTLTFFHISDLHLDNFPPVKGENDEMAACLHESAYGALKNFSALCAKIRPHFVVYTGDLHEHGLLSLKARFALNNFFEELKNLNIPFYYVCGNHDHLGQNEAFFREAENVYRFGEEWETLFYPPDLSEGGRPLCLVSGISHTVRKEERNLVRDFHCEPSELFHIGMLHATVNSSEQVKNTDKHVVALCRESDFADLPVDYWALGHIHETALLSEKPMLYYAGAMQATRMGETGAHGATLVRVENLESKENRSISREFFPLAPLETYHFSLAVDTEAEDAEQCLAGFEKAFREQLNGLADNPFCTARIFTVSLEGSHDLYASFREEDFCEELKKRLEKGSESFSLEPKIFVKKIKNLVRPCFDFESAGKRDDLMGEVFRVLDEVRNNPELFEEIFKKIEGDFKIKDDFDLGFFEHSDKRSRKQMEKYRQSLLRACECIFVNFLEPK